MPTPVLYCRDALKPRSVDAHFAPEAREVRARGGTVGLIDHDTLLRGDAQQAVALVPAGLGNVWYRGWMIPGDRYAALAAALSRRGTELLVSPEQYRTAHELPGWYATFAEITPASVWRPTEPGEVLTADDLTALTEPLPPGAGIVKDYVKSRKHEWEQACFIPDLARAGELTRVVQRFVELQEESLTGGVVVRAFETFPKLESVAAEVRVWWLDGEPGLLTPHPDSPFGRGLVPDLDHIGPAVRRLGCRFVTTDVALRSDGVWRVVEVGDGQVSDLHRSADLSAFAALLIDPPAAGAAHSR
ncbi:ATP-grasp domain-containing protein [Streptomyces sp. NBC_00536]|uniref:ATP-grasp domain-containing protein n=1 Tax=Streptomyces sp. NBC_00536 TaxID=2975769 RepID=UPI002E801E57|nr:ATP-grasp domain-containing protein [Streptomyces sp. NBC_00536]WUC78475.1 ATP-grasp domain-containing protein [Streptomyces sp. NBC_00536]